MRIRLAPSVAALAVAGFLAWTTTLGRGSRVGPEGPSPSATGQPERVLLRPAGPGGSAVPCAVPLGWRLARLDEGFGLTRAEARSALQGATALWNDAVGRLLFAYKPEEGFPVHFVDDGRQARSRERVRAEAELEAADQRLDRERRALADRQATLVRRRAAYQERLEELRRRLEAHNTAVRRLNEGGGGGEARARELVARGDSLEAAREALDRDRSRIEAAAAELDDAVATFNRAVDAHQRRSDSLERAHPPAAVEKAVYREKVVRDDGRPVRVRREIRIHRFDGLDDLQRVAAHELGHALGLGHLTGPGAVMSESYGPGEAGEDLRGDHPGPRDLELLRRSCPGL